MIYFPNIPDSAWLLLGILILLALVWGGTFLATDFLRRKVLRVSYTCDSTDFPESLSAWLVTVAVGIAMMAWLL